MASARTAVPYSVGTQPPGFVPPPLACDCHMHVYDSAYPAALGARLRPPDASVDDYRLLQQRLGTARTVVVTPSTYGTDNRCLLDALHRLGPQARGVAVIDGSESDAELQRLHGAGVRGARLNLSLGVSGHVDAIVPLSHRLADMGWHLQLLMAPELLATLGDVLRQSPVPLVFDHFGRIQPGADAHLPAHALLLQLLGEGRAWIKLSGGYIVSASGSIDDPGLDALARSYLAAAPDRVLWGSDWPHATASAGLQPMPDDARQLDRLAGWAGDDALLAQILVHNPQRLYDFPLAPTSH